MSKSCTGFSSLHLEDTRWSFHCVLFVRQSQVPDTFKRKEQRFCHLMDGLVARWARGAASIIIAILGNYSVHHVISYSIPLGLSVICSGWSVFFCDTSSDHLKVGSNLSLWIIWEALLLSPSPAWALAASSTNVKSVNFCCLSQSCMQSSVGTQLSILSHPAVGCRVTTELYEMTPTPPHVNFT